MRGALFLKEEQLGTDWKPKAELLLGKVAAET